MRSLALLVLVSSFAIACSAADGASEPSAIEVARDSTDASTSPSVNDASSVDVRVYDASVRVADAGGADGAALVDGAPDVVDAGCPAPTGVVVPAGGTITRPAETVMRLTLAYQGPVLAVTALTPVNMVLPPSSGVFTPGVHAGYWFALEGASGQTIYTRVVSDPTVVEGVLADGGLVAGRAPFCDAKVIHVDAPNDPSATALVVYGSPYATDDPAIELARFSL